MDRWMDGWIVEVVIIIINIITIIIIIMKNTRYIPVGKSCSGRIYSI
jgi:hypothetical protein